MSFLLPNRVSVAPRACCWRGTYIWIGRLVVVVCFSLTLNVAAASCGDYLHGMADKGSFLVQPHETNPTDLTRILPTNPRKPRECFGPTCRQAPAIPRDQPQSVSIRPPIKDICFDQQRIAVIEEFWVGVECSSELDLKSPDNVRLERPPQLA